MTKAVYCVTLKVWDPLLFYLFPCPLVKQETLRHRPVDNAPDP